MSASEEINPMKPKLSTRLDEEVGRRIKTRRLELGITQSGLADALGLTFQQIQKYEKGRNRVGAGRLQEIAKILHVPLTFFFDEQLGGSDGGSELFALLQTSYALRLLKAFSQIKDREVRRVTVELIEQISDISVPRRRDN